MLAYHGVGTLPHGLDPHGMQMPPERLRRHVEILRRRGYRCVAQAELARLLAAGRAQGACSLTFDDGLADNLTTLLPILEELELPATVYACPGLLGEPYPFAAPEAGLRFLTEEELRRLAAHPLVEIGSHTRHHTALDDATAEAAEEEMRASRTDLERLVDAEVLSFAYPNCGYSPACPEAARRAGYTSAVTCGARGGLTPFELERVSPNPVEGRLTFELRLRGLFYRVRDVPPARLARRALRPLRYRG